jgi:hypothetical protein
MKVVVQSLAALVMVSFMASGAMALEPNQICDKSKTKAVSKLFQSCMKCQNKNYIDGTFDEVACRAAAETKCTETFAAADTKGAGACFLEGNGVTVCGDTTDSCILIYTGI